jgi:hypothetical protein
MAFNNRPATDTIPFLSPFIAPSARALAPLLSQLATPGPLRATVESATDALRGLSPSLVRQVMPMIDQLSPIFLDVSQVGRLEGWAVSGELLRQEVLHEAGWESCWVPAHAERPQVFFWGGVSGHRPGGANQMAVVGLVSSAAQSSPVCQAATGGRPERHNAH